MAAVLCASAELAVMQPLLVRDAAGGLILLRLPEGRAVAYRNACPHMGIELDWEPRRLLSHDGRWLRCTGHGALFRPEDGMCLAGPCRGESLRAVPVREQDGQVVADG